VGKNVGAVDQLLRVVIVLNISSAMYKKKPKDVSLQKFKQRKGKKIYKRSTKTKQKLKKY